MQFNWAEGKNLAILQELSKKRAESISNVFGKILSYGSKLETFLEIASCENTKRSTDVETSVEILDSAYKSLADEADRNRFLIGEDLYLKSKQLSQLIYVQLYQIMIKALMV